MTEPLTPERLAAIRAGYDDGVDDALEGLLDLMATGRDRWLTDPNARLRWSADLTTYQADHVALLAEVDRLTTENEQLTDLDAAATRRTELHAERDRAVQRWHLEHERAETLEAENAQLHRRAQIAENALGSARVQANSLLESSRLGVTNNPDDDAWKTAHWHTRQLRIALNAGYAVAAWSAEFSFARTDKPDTALWCTPVPEQSARSFMADYATRHPDWSFALMRRTVGPWLPVTEATEARSGPQSPVRDGALSEGPGNAPEPSTDPTGVISTPETPQH